MASSNLQSNKFAFGYVIGVNSKGEDVYKFQTFSNVNVAITDTLIVGFINLVETKLLNDEYSIDNINKEQVYSVSRI